MKYSEKVEKISHSDELFTVKFRYKKPKENKSIEMIHVCASNMKKEVSADFRFAASVAWFGMKLRGSEYVQNQNIEDIISLAKNSKGNDEQGYRAEFIRLVNSQVN